jgi:transposase
MRFRETVTVVADEPSRMVTGSTTSTTCRNCGFATRTDSDEWDAADHPSLGTITQCPECGSTDTTTRE